jgi:hypothetical protein
MWSKGDPKQNRSEIRAPSLEQFTIHSQKKQFTERLRDLNISNRTGDCSAEVDLREIITLATY